MDALFHRWIHRAPSNNVSLCGSSRDISRALIQQITGSQLREVGIPLESRRGLARVS